jgi:hypothetical protein
VGSLRIDAGAEALVAHPAGYLRATGVGCLLGAGEQQGSGIAGEHAGGGDAASGVTDTGRAVRCVCVVGLAHCNGMVAQLAAADTGGEEPRLYELASRTDSYDELLL